MKATFELTNHTADIALHVRAPSLQELVHPAAVGFYSVIGEVATIASTASSKRFAFQGDNAAILIRDYLAELQYLFDTEHRAVVGEAKVRINDKELVVDALLERIDLEASVLQHEIKAVTYHNLELHRTDEGFEVTIIIDI